MPLYHQGKGDPGSPESINPTLFACKIVSDLIEDPTTGKKYLVGEKQHNFLTSRIKCSRYGGHLPEPRNEHENNFLDKLTPNSNKFFLGMTDAETEGDWVWRTDSTSVTWYNWKVWGDDRGAEPNGGQEENCVVMLKLTERGESSKWGDRPCSDTATVVCEVPGGKSN